MTSIPDSRTDVSHVRQVTVEIDITLLSVEAVLKTCHWFARDFICNPKKRGEATMQVVISPHDPSATFVPDAVRALFIRDVIDFDLRGKIEAKTSGVRDLLLAKAFSESGVLEDSPQGKIGDIIEESKSDGMLKVLSES